MSETRKRLLTCAVCGLIGVFCLAMFVGISRNIGADNTLPANAMPAADPVQEFRMEREQMRAMQKAQLNDILHDESTDEEIKQMAQRQLMDLCGREEKELMLEGMLTMRGFQDPVAVVQSDSANIFIRAELITQQQSGIIMELVCRETGVQSGNIKIIPIN